MDKKTRVNRWLNDSSCVTEILDNTTEAVDKIGSFIIHSRLQFTSELLHGLLLFVIFAATIVTELHSLIAVVSYKLILRGSLLFP